MPSSMTLPLQAHTGKQFLAFRNFNERVNQATRLMTKQCQAVRLGDTAVSRTRRDFDTDLRMAFILEKPI